MIHTCRCFPQIEVGKVVHTHQPLFCMNDPEWEFNLGRDGRLYQIAIELPKGAVIQCYDLFNVSGKDNDNKQNNIVSCSSFTNNNYQGKYRTVIIPPSTFTLKNENEDVYRD